MSAAGSVWHHLAQRNFSFFCKEGAGCLVNKAKRLRELEAENAKLKKLLAEAT